MPAGAVPTFENVWILLMLRLKALALETLVLGFDVNAHPR